MSDAATVREFLHADSTVRIREIGVFRAPPVDLGGPVAVKEIPEGEEFSVSDEWFSDSELEAHFSDEPRISAILPRGRVKRLDVDPRILTFEDLPPPRAMHGPVFEDPRGRWVMDSRAAPAILVLRANRHDIVLWGEGGELRVYVLRQAS